MKTKEEGPQLGFKSGYRPNLVFELPDDSRDLKTYIGDIEFDDQVLIEPGQTKQVGVCFLKMAEVEKYSVAATASQSPVRVFLTQSNQSGKNN